MSYVALCAGCHGLDGNGMPNTVVAMRNNSTLAACRSAQSDRGDAGRHWGANFPHHASMQAMPGFSDKLSDAEAAALANYCASPGAGRRAT
jgi:Cytochrome c.